METSDHRRQVHKEDKEDEERGEQGVWITREGGRGGERTEKVGKAVNGLF